METQNKLCKLILNLTGSQVMSPLPDHNSDTDLADKFTQFFITKIDTIREMVIHIALYALYDSDIPMVYNLTHSLKKMSRG